MQKITLDLIEQASRYLHGKVRKTPTEFSPALSKLLHHPVYLKLESLQTTGSFKIRGAFFCLATLNQEEKRRGVAGCSAGNHGLGLAFAAKQLGIACTIFVPKNVDQVKYEKLWELGATVRKSAFMGYDDTLAWGIKEAEKEGLLLISAFDDPRIMAGNGGSLAMEVLEEIPDASHFVLPVGGGGLSAGFSYYIKEKAPQAFITGCQHVLCPALKLSLERGEAATYMPSIETLAGGIEGGMGVQCFEILKTRIDQVALVAEEEIKKGVQWMLQEHQYLIEPTASVVIAAILSGQIRPKGSTVLVLSGRNVSYLNFFKSLYHPETRGP